MNRWSHWALALLSLFALGLTSEVHGAASEEVFTITEADRSAIATQINAFSHDLEHLRRFAGAPKINDLDLGIYSTLPRDLYFQALTLWEQTDRLAFEILRVHAKPPPSTPDSISAETVVSRLRDAHDYLRQVLQQLQIADTDSGAAAQDLPPVEFFSHMANLNRQLNLLLEQPLSPSDVHQKITLAMGYAARLLARYPDAERIPAEPPFEPNKQPGDVYLRLMQCLQSIARLFDRAGLATFNLDPSQIDPNRFTSNEVYLAATLIVSHLDFLHRLLSGVKSPPQPFYPGRKFPAHNYQRAGILLAQLQQLERYLTPDQLAKPTPESP